MPTSALSRTGRRADVGIGPYDSIVAHDGEVTF